jgi:hypothetical protein
MLFTYLFIYLFYSISNQNLQIFTYKYVFYICVYGYPIYQLTMN